MSFRIVSVLVRKFMLMCLCVCVFARKFPAVLIIYELNHLPASCSILLLPREQLTDEQKLQVSMACAGARALCSLSESKPNKEAMRKYGLVPLMSRLLKSIHIDLIVPIMGTCQNCASEVI